MSGERLEKEVRALWERSRTVVRAGSRGKYLRACHGTVRQSEVLCSHLVTWWLQLTRTVYEGVWCEGPGRKWWRMQEQSPEQSGLITVL